MKGAVGCFCHVISISSSFSWIDQWSSSVITWTWINCHSLIILIRAKVLKLVIDVGKTSILKSELHLGNILKSCTSWVDCFNMLPIIIAPLHLCSDMVGSWWVEVWCIYIYTILLYVYVRGLSWFFFPSIKFDHPWLTSPRSHDLHQGTSQKRTTATTRWSTTPREGQKRQQTSRYSPGVIKKQKEDDYHVFVQKSWGIYCTINTFSMFCIFLHFWL